MQCQKDTQTPHCSLGEAEKEGMYYFLVLCKGHVQSTRR